jgi:hypothetical protein
MTKTILPMQTSAKLWMINQITNTKYYKCSSKKLTNILAHDEENNASKACNSFIDNKT